MREEFNMFVSILLKWDHIPKKLRKEAEKYFKKSENLHYRPLGFFHPDNKLGLFDFDGGEHPTVDGIETVLAELSLHGFGYDHIMLTERAYLDDDSIKPPRGRYERGNSKAEVDSYIKSSSNDAYPVWKIVIRGDNAQSVFELYSRIRQGLEKPKEWWDKKSEGSDKK